MVNNAVTNFYRNNTLTIKHNNQLCEGFCATRGIRQGCTLSPLIYAISTDSLLRILRDSLPGITTRAFADDTAVVLQSWKTQSKKLNTIMGTYSNITTMSINSKKTIVIHLGDADKHPDVNLQSPKYTWDTKGKYLGYMIGPGAGDTSWSVPTEKYTSRLNDWPWAKMGANF